MLHDAILKHLHASYDGPFGLIGQKSKYFLLDANGKEDWNSIDRLKTATILPSDAENQEVVNKWPHLP